MRGTHRLRARDRPHRPSGRGSSDGPTYADDLDRFDLLVRSPGVHPRVLPADITTTSVTQEFLDHCPIPVIGVTGTYGKGTTCTVITRILEAAGQQVLPAGNIGTPPLPFLDRMNAFDVVVLELSTQQLIDLGTSPGIAVVLDVQPDHLDWHDTVDDYFRSKESIAAHQRSGDTVIFNPRPSGLDHDRGDQRRHSTAARKRRHRDGH